VLFRAEAAWAAPGALIPVVFAPDGFGRVDPPEAVTVLLPIGELQASISGTFEQINANVCTYQPFFASAEAAQGWLASHPGGRVFTVGEMFGRPWGRYYPDRLAAVLNAALSVRDSLAGPRGRGSITRPASGRAPPPRSRSGRLTCRLRMATSCRRASKSRSRSTSAWAWSRSMATNSRARALTDAKSTSRQDSRDSSPASSRR